MVHEHPLAYLLGVEGIALQRAATGHGTHGREFVEARLAEVRRLLADPRLATGVDVERVGTTEGYREWSTRYDVPNTAFGDRDHVLPFLAAVPAGDALDAACGTGRWSTELAALGHRVTGVDSSPEMLALARRRVPDAQFLEADLHTLPFPDAAFDVVVFALAASHVPDLVPVFTEFARVVRPGGTVLVSDVHPDQIRRGSIPSTPGPDGEPRRILGVEHRVGAQFRAARAAGLQVLDCVEPVGHGTTPAGDDPGPWWDWPWSLEALVPEATDAAYAGLPGLLVWRFSR
jgi:SAM-dependent methyltransferase